MRTYPCAARSQTLDRDATIRVGLTKTMQERIDFCLILCIDLAAHFGLPLSQDRTSRILVFMIRVIFVSALWLAYPFLSVAQVNKYKFERISVESGLSHSIVYSIAQDKKGFLWFGTQKGLNRYNGYTFDVFENDPLDSTTVSEDDVSLVYEDHEGKFWLATWGGGLNLFDPVTETFQRFGHDPNRSGTISDDFIQSIFEDKDNVMWIGTGYGGLNRFDRATKTFVRYLPDPANPTALHDGRVWSIQEVDGHLWLGTNAGLSKFDRVKGTFENFPSLNVPGATQPIQIRTLYLDRSGRFWVGGQRGPGVFDRTTQRVEFLTVRGMDKTITNCFYEDEFGGIWIGTNGFGLYEYNPHTRTAKHFVQDPNNPSTLGFDDIRDIYEDQAGTLWIATRGGGISKLNRNTEKVTHFFWDHQNPNSLSTNNIRALLLDRAGRLWIGTDGAAIDMWDPRTQKIRHYPNVCNKYVYGLSPMKSGEILVSTRQGLTILDPRTERSVTYVEEFGPAVGGFHPVSAALEDARGRIWVGTLGNGLFLWDRAKRERIRFRDRIEGTDIQMDNEIFCIFEDRAGGIWIGSANSGLYYHDPQKNIWKHYQPDPRNPSSIGYVRIRHLYEDPAGTLWIASEGGGVLILDRTTETFSRYTETDGLSHNVVYGILPDENGHLWMSTNNGLSRLNPVSRTFINYYESDGFQGNVYLPNAFLKGPDGSLYFAGINGLNQFRPSDIRPNHHVPPIVLTSFRLFDRAVRFDRALTEIENVNLSYRDNFFGFEFAALDYVTSAKNQYAYKLEGFDDNWIECGTRRFASYTNLDGGDYVFRVRGSNNDRIWNDQGLTIRVHISPPFWATWWFRIGAFVLVVGLVYAFFRRRLKSVEAHRTMLEREIAARTRELRDQKDQLEKALAYLRETQAHLIQTEKMASLGQLTAGIAHEINNPLSFIDGNLNYFEDYLRGLMEMIERSEKVILQPNDDWKAKIEQLVNLRQVHDYHYVREDVTKILTSCKKGTERIKKIIQELRNFANLDDTELRFADVHAGIQTTLSLLASQYNDRIEVIQEFGDLPQILCYPGSLNQVFVNLMLNAIDAIPNKGTVTIRTRRIMRDQQPWVEIAFEDTGVGIEAEHLSKIYDPFFTTKEVGHGTGLGLTIVYGIVEKHYGQIDCQSTPGRGTKFVLQLPVESPHLKRMRL